MLGGFVDDPTIGDDERLLRRIPPWHFYFDKNLGRQRPTSAAFEDHPNGSPMSVHLESVRMVHGLAFESVLADHDGFAVAGISAGLARTNGQGIMRKPRANDPAHAEVFGLKPEGLRRKFAKASDWVIAPAI
jgi:hypothetical protein